MTPLSMSPQQRQSPPGNKPNVPAEDEGQIRVGILRGPRRTNANYLRFDTDLAYNKPMSLFVCGTQRDASS